MQFVGSANEVESPRTLLRKKEFKRRLTSPSTPLLQKLPHGDESSSRRCHEASRRLKDRREEAQTLRNESLVRAELQNQQQQCRERYLARWYHIRNLYAAVSEMMTAQNQAMVNTAKLPRATVVVPMIGPSSVEPGIIPAPLHTLTAMSWLIDLAREFRQGFAAYNVTRAQVEIALGTALHLTLSSAQTSMSTTRIASCLRNVFQAFQHQPGSNSIDYREMLNALSVLDRWREGEKKMVSRWFNEFAFPLAENSPAIGDMKMAVRGSDLQWLFTACGDEADESRMQPYFTALLAAMNKRGRSYISEVVFWEYADGHPKLLEIIRTQCWKRLTDDTRLNFYRDVYSHAKERFVKEEARARFERAIGIWRTREPRQRLARWKSFVTYRKLLRRGDTHFRSIAAAKIVRGFRRNCKRRQEMFRWIKLARSHRNTALLRFAFKPWALFWRSVQLIHNAAWRRSERHDVYTHQKRHWLSWVVFYNDEKARRAYCDKVAATFIANRHRKNLRSFMDTWLVHKCRYDEVTAGDIRSRQLQRDLFLLQQVEAEHAAMEVEDKLSTAVAARARATAEMGRRRSFIEATDRVHATRKLQKQKDERLQYKTSREHAAKMEAKQAWTAIGEQVATEVRTAALTWLTTPDAKDQVHEEATRIFELDAKWIRDELERNPNNGPARILPTGCRWQVYLEAPHGAVTRRLTKAFYLNTTTYEKYWCDEVVMDDCEGIAKEVIIRRRIDEALARLDEKEAEWALQRRQSIAAVRIQMMFRCRQARAVCRRIIRNTFIKRVDPSSAQLMYFNMARPNEIRRRPPKLIGSDEPLIPIESSTWVYRQDTHGNGYYERVDTGESSAGPPDHYILCTRCSVHFVTRRKLVSGARYCIGCYANFRFAARRDRNGDTSSEEETGWTKMPVQPSNCMVCRNTPAEFVCSDCKYDATCLRCFHAVHDRLAKSKTHAPPVSLVNRSTE